MYDIESAKKDILIDIEYEITHSTEYSYMYVKNIIENGSMPFACIPDFIDTSVRNPHENICIGDEKYIRPYTLKAMANLIRSYLRRVDNNKQIKNAISNRLLKMCHHVDVHSPNRKDAMYKLMEIIMQAIDESSDIQTVFQLACCYLNYAQDISHISKDERTNIIVKFNKILIDFAKENVNSVHTIYGMIKDVLNAVIEEYHKTNNSIYKIQIYIIPW